MHFVVLFEWNSKFRNNKMHALPFPNFIEQKETISVENKNQTSLNIL